MKIILCRKRFLFVTVLSISLCSSLIFGVEADSTMWSQTYGGASDEFGQCVVETSDGGYAIAGDTYSFGNRGGDFWLVKTDENGNMEWNQTYGGALGDGFGDMCQTSDGGYAMAGTTSSFGSGEDDFWLVKTDALGNMEWNKTYGGAELEIAFSLIATSDGGYAIAGTTTPISEPGDFDDVGDSDFWLVKTDALGNMEWNKTYGGAEFDVGRSIVLTSDGGYAIAGSTESFGARDTDFWLVKTDSFGNMEWNKTYGGTEYNTLASIVVTSDGGYALAGDKHLGAGSADFWLVKTDENGNAQWNQTYGGPFNEYAYSAVETNDGGYAIAGYTTSFGAGGGDFWLVKTDENGNAQWNQTYGGTDTDSGWCVVETFEGGYAIAGYTYVGLLNSDFLLVKTDEYGVVPETAWVVLPILVIATLTIFLTKKKLLRKFSKEN